MVGHEPAVGSGLEAKIETTMNVSTMGRVAWSKEMQHGCEKDRRASWVSP